MSELIKEVKVKKLCEDAKLPTKKRKEDACWDLCTTEDLQLYPLSPKMVGTGLSMEIPAGYELLIRPRSGLSSKGVIILNSPGTIDSNYRGEIKILMMATVDGYRLLKNERLAQCTVKKLEDYYFIEVDELTDTDRNAEGFGSSGRL